MFQRHQLLATKARVLDKTGGKYMIKIIRINEAQAITMHGMNVKSTSMSEESELYARSPKIAKNKIKNLLRLPVPR